VPDDRSLEDNLVQATIFSVPFGVFSIETGFVNISPPNLLIIMTIIYFSIVAVLQGGLRLSKVQVFVLGLFSVAIGLISITLFVQSGSSRRLVTYIGYLLLTVILFLYIDSITDAKRVLRAAFLSAVAISLLTIVHSVTYPVGLPFGSAYIGQRTVAGVTVPFQRTQGLPRTSYGAFGMTLMVGTPYYLYIGLKERSKSILFGVSLVLLAVLILQSRSTWAATGLAVFTVMSGYVMKEYGKKINIAYSVAVVLPAILLLPIVVEALISIQSRSFFARIEQYRVALNLLRSNPLVGVGLGNVDQFYTAYAIHSEFLRIGAEAGAAVLLIIVAIWVVSALSVTKGAFLLPARYELCVGVLASIGVMIIETNMSPGFSKASWIILAIGLGIYSTD
jgi:O-antigen ligase